MSEVFSCELLDEIKFNINEPIQVQDIVKSLEALEKIVKQSTKTFSKLGKSDVHDVKLYIKAIEKGSLREKIIIKLIFKTEENLDKFLENTHDWVAKQCKEHPVRSSLVGLVIGGMIAYGFYSLGTNSANSINISGNYNTVITNGAQQLNIPIEEFKKAIEENKSNKKSLSKNAVEFAQPAKTPSGDVSIEFGSDIDSSKNIIIPSKVISDIPKKVEPEQPIEKDTRMDNVTLHIRALDRDDYSGWSGYIEGVFTKRIPIEIPHTIALNEISSQEAIKANVTIFYTQKGNTINQKRIVIREINPKLKQ
ncbi:hypothetical protein [Gallibacterium sp. AGMB14963]|uniref:hypothetical protein n=1 Tax=Gallibacterium faecale TaxID=3019086 RepID=UPI0022F199DC|nr:hypothetical protein [Gallibacterium sp. AGMB14963]MDA3979861.1 hypothetical protein [Gallibacterium sp. AGMB14963]